MLIELVPGGHLYQLLCDKPQALKRFLSRGSQQAPRESASTERVRCCFLIDLEAQAAVRVTLVGCFMPFLCFVFDTKFRRKPRDSRLYAAARGLKDSKGNFISF